MASNQEKADFLAEHVRYELLMLRYTLGRMSVPQLWLDWNSFYESFAVHARTLYQFLCNTSDNREFMAKDYCSGFKAEKKEEMVGAMEQLRRQVLHLAKNRPYDDEHKFQLANAKTVSDWLEANFKRFIGELEPSFRSHWNPDATDPSKFAAPNVTIETPGGPPGVLYTTGPTGAGTQTASSQPTAASSGFQPSKPPNRGGQ